MATMEKSKYTERVPVAEESLHLANGEDGGMREPTAMEMEIETGAGRRSLLPSLAVIVALLVCKGLLYGTALLAVIGVAVDIPPGPWAIAVDLAVALAVIAFWLNRAAEAAAPEAKELFWQAISEMTLDDVRRIYDGPDDAATRYFQDKMTPPLAKRMEPVVDRSLADVGAIQSYDNMMGQYESVPFVPDVKADLISYVVEKAMDGLFYYVAKEEAAIRNNPAARTTEILRRVFGAG
jgi:hypothetical protein